MRLIHVVSRVQPEKGLIDTLSAEAQLNPLLGDEPSRVHANRERAAIPCSGRPYLKPCTLILFFLGIALVAWGYGDRLTRYKNSPDPLKRTLVARFWVDQQSNQRDVSAKLQTPAHSIFDLYLPVDAAQLVSHHYAETILAAPRVPRAVAFIHSLLPLRSPPSNSFLA